MGDLDKEDRGRWISAFSGLGVQRVASRSLHVFFVAIAEARNGRAQGTPGSPCHPASFEDSGLAFGAGRIKVICLFLSREGGLSLIRV